jgi:hypothetical protein
MLEEEVDGLLARQRYERRAGVDAPGGDRNGFGKPRRLSLSNGTITLRRPRVRGLSRSPRHHRQDAEADLPRSQKPQ